eukprot:715347-Pelagomonas_calceolata.AAC.2
MLRLHLQEAQVQGCEGAQALARSVNATHTHTHTHTYAPVPAAPCALLQRRRVWRCHCFAAWLAPPAGCPPLSRTYPPQQTHPWRLAWRLHARAQ